MKNGELKIDKGIEIPRRPVKKGYSQALRALKKGESVLLPISYLPGGLMRQVDNRPGVFSTRREEGGFRVWRIK